MNDQWRNLDADAHESKAEALDFASQTVEGVEPMLDAVEVPVIRNARAILERARNRHIDAAKLGRVA